MKKIITLVFGLFAFSQSQADNNGHVNTLRKDTGTPNVVTAFGDTMMLGNFLPSNIVQTTFLLMIDYLTNSKGFIKYTRKSDGALMAFDSVFVLGNISTDSVKAGKITQASGTTETYYAEAWNNAYPTVHALDSVTVTTKTASASVAYIDTLNMATITSDGGSVHFKIHTDSIIGYTMKFEKSVDGGTWSVFYISTSTTRVLDSMVLLAGTPADTPVCVRLTTTNSKGNQTKSICFRTAKVTVVPPTIECFVPRVSGLYVTDTAKITSNDPKKVKVGYWIYQQPDSINSIAGSTFDSLSGGTNVLYVKTMGPFAVGAYYLRCYSFNSAGMTNGPLYPFVIITSGVPGVNLNASVQLELFPNPMIDQATFTVTDAGYLRIYNSLGATLAEKRIGPTQSYIFERNGIVAGLYFYSFTGDEGGKMISGKIIIQ